MAYEYIEPQQSGNANIPQEPRICRWFFAVEDFMERIKMESAYIAVAIKDKEGAPQVDDFAITQDENDIAYLIIMRVCKDIAKTEFEKLARESFKIATDKSDITKTKVIFDAEATPEGDGNEWGVDTAILDYVASSSLVQWLTIKGLGNYIKVYMDKANKAKAELHRALFTFRM